MYHSFVRRLLRPVAVFLTLVLLQLVLVESGYACGVSSHGAVGGESMATMPMPGSPANASSEPMQQDHQQAPCQFPWAPNCCQAMACGQAALTTAPGAVEPIARVHIAALRLEPLAPLSLSLAPELPPPRA
jgi:hypothetical protein